MGKQAVLKIQHPIMPGLGDRSNPSPPMDRPRGKAAHQACPPPLLPVAEWIRHDPEFSGAWTPPMGTTPTTGRWHRGRTPCSRS